jgi:hypothetical protein
MRNLTGEQLAKVDNPDPFASPVWRSPVYRTPGGVILLAQLVRLAARVIWFMVRHPLLDAVAGLLVLVWLGVGWSGLVILAAVALAALAVLAVLRLAWPRPAGVPPGPQPVAVVVLPAALAGGDDHYPARPGLPWPGRRPGPRQGQPGPDCERGRRGRPGHRP